MLELLAIMTSIPMKPRTATNGRSQYFLLFIRNRHQAALMPVISKHSPYRIIAPGKIQILRCSFERRPEIKATHKFRAGLIACNPPKSTLTCRERKRRFLELRHLDERRLWQPRTVCPGLLETPLRHQSLQNHPAAQGRKRVDIFP
jgi:hypothetical protein